MKARAWAVSWLAVALLGVVWFVLMQVAPACRREWRNRCDVWSNDGVFLHGLPVLGLAVLVAFGISIWSLLRRGHPVLAGALSLVLLLMMMGVTGL